MHVAHRATSSGQTARGMCGCRQALPEVQVPRPAVARSDGAEPLGERGEFVIDEVKDQVGIHAEVLVNNDVP